MATKQIEVDAILALASEGLATTEDAIKARVEKLRADARAEKARKAAEPKVPKARVEEHSWDTVAEALSARTPSGAFHSGFHTNGTRIVCFKKGPGPVPAGFKPISLAELVEKVL